MTMITPSYLGETIEYSSLHACRSTLEDPTFYRHLAEVVELDQALGPRPHDDVVLMLGRIIEDRGKYVTQFAETAFAVEPDLLACGIGERQVK